MDKRRVRHLFLCLLLVSILLPLRAEALDIKPHLCRDNLFIAVAQLVQRDFPDQALGFSLEAFNEVRCEKTEELTQQAESEKEDMANALITVKLKKESHYTLVHVHFDKDGSFIEAYPKWTTFTKTIEWETEWCEFIGYVYPDERGDQGCPIKH